MVAPMIRPALMLLLLFTLITGLLYPLVVTGVGQALFPGKANGSILHRGSRPVGSSLIGQEFTSTRYFWGRLSGTSPLPYNASASSGSNDGPLHPRLLAAARARADRLRAADPLNTQAVPVDLVTASGSGLDPHISPSAAMYQVPRIARQRALSPADVRALVVRYTEERDLGIWGEPRVNVLKLILALDALEPAPGRR